ncbi:MAG: hypothetical protein AAGF53_01555 [Pseudomonadota bacterium]
MKKVTSTTRRKVLGLLGSTALAACSAPQIVSRDANDPFEGGIGGTGIVGLLTDFGSLIVNGLRVEVENDTKVVSAYGVVSQDVLAPGMALTVYATRNRDAIIARQVSVDYALVGTAQRDGVNFSVNGVSVFLEPGALGRFDNGARVALNGAWAKEGFVASRVDPAPDARDLIAGTVNHSGAGGFDIGGAQIAFSGPRPGAGEYGVAIGRGNRSRFEAQSLKTGRFNGVPSLTQLSVEGFLEPVAARPGFRVAGLGHSFAPNVMLAPLAQSRAIYFGPYNGRFRARAGYLMPQDLVARRGLLKNGFADGFDGQIVKT